MPNNLPVVSIIIPCYNYARFLSDAIGSALEQAYEQCEVIVVDDGSTDNTSEVAASFGKRIRYIYQENKGHSAARNTGIQASSGEFVVYLDADDVLKPQMVAHSLQTMKRLGEEFGIVAGRCSRIDREGCDLVFTVEFPAVDCEVTALDLLIRNRFPPTLLARREVFDKCGGWDEQLLGSEDRDMWLRVALKYKILRSGEVFLSLRRHGDNVSGDGVMMARGIKRVQEKALEAGVITGWKNVYRLKAKSFYLYQKGMMGALKCPFRSFLNVVVSVVMWPVFYDIENLGEKRWFRFKMMGWILSQYLKQEGKEG